MEVVHEEYIGMDIFTFQRKGSDSKLRFLSLTAIWSDAILQSGKVPKGWDKLVVSVVSVETDLSSSPISDLRSPKPNFSSSVKCLYPLKYPSFPILLWFSHSKANKLRSGHSLLVAIKYNSCGSR
ncbi:uncharacterized protein LOC133031011 [Cannabis sativa]|uniref:uncharacterized protein LOC133031011 n=1 Tax=Cannabis sativa TaxID=3483 RepID=UPI0029CA6BBD|nr:uncharacterized protein LOC133031011 [Cannabis sativa]